jgi:antibiotic biosynthesis monooxygenase (ABM) superfamily enzyme
LPDFKKTTMKQPPKWKFALLVWIAIYPSITFLSYLIGDWLVAFPLPLRTLILTGILVPLMVFVLLPLLRKFLGNWLQK